MAPPHSLVLFFRGSLAADTVILPCFRFRKENLSSAVEGTPKGVQKRYARLSNLLCGFFMSPTMFQALTRKRRIFRTVAKRSRGSKFPWRINSVRP